jgi:hypothetical protein
VNIELFFTVFIPAISMSKKNITETTYCIASKQNMGHKHVIMFNNFIG